MSRFAVERDPAPDSFAGLLDHLTREAVSGKASRGLGRGPQPERETGSGSGPNSSARTTPTTAATAPVAAPPAPRAGRGIAGRALLPVSEAKTGRAKAAAGAAALTYEEALRIHNRRASPSKEEIPLSPTKPRKPEKVEKPPLAASRDAGPKANGTAQNGDAPAPQRVVPDRKTPAKPANAPRRRSKKTASPPSLEPRPADDRDTRRHDPAGTAKKSSAHPGSSPRRAAKVGKTKPIPEEHIPRALHASVDSVEYPPSLGSIGTDRDLRGVPVSEINPGDGSIQRIHGAQALANTQLAQRRVIVSLRLTDGEFARLCDRAQESGITVSAYMRSCIVDADQLRAQVKQALAQIREQMRAFSLRPESGRFPAFADSHPTTAKDGSWFWPLLRSAAGFLSPLFPFRRSA